MTWQWKFYKLKGENKQDAKLDNFERLEREVERLLDAYAKLKEEMATIRHTTQEKGREIAELQRRVESLERDRQLALKKIEQLLEQLNQFDLG